MFRRQSKRQRGVVIVQVVIAMAAILGVAALAVDLGHAYLNKTRLQNAVDSAALAAAKVISATKSTSQATAAAEWVMGQNSHASGNKELGDAWDAGEIDFDMTYSATLNPFTSGSTSGPYVRAQALGFSLNSLFARVLGINQLNVSASAVAGPSAPITPCNVLPVMACGDPAASDFGYPVGSVQLLKGSAKTPKDLSEVGPGNYQLIRLEGDEGGGDLRNALAGVFSRCIAPGESIQTEPGVTMGPTSQGIEARFATCSHPLDCASYGIKPDRVVTPDISYAAYLSRYLNESWDNPPPQGVPERRVVVVPIGNCTGTLNGASDDVPLLGFGCFFLIRSVSAKDPDLYGEFISRCNAEGSPGSGGGSGSGSVIYEIVLHNDPLSDDS